MLHQAHFDIKGGNRNFAALSREVCCTDFPAFRCTCPNGRISEVMRKRRRWSLVFSIDLRIYCCEVNFTETSAHSHSSGEWLNSKGPGRWLPLETAFGLCKVIARPKGGEDGRDGPQ
jgi:hypothetical protein